MTYKQNLKAIGSSPANTFFNHHTALELSRQSLAPQDPYDTDLWIHGQRKPKPKTFKQELQDEINEWLKV